MTVIIRPARAIEHETILRIARQTKWTKDFGNTIMFSSPEHYARNWIYVAVQSGRIVGFACIREKTRAPEVVLYFVGVHEDCRQRGIGQRLIETFMGEVTHPRLVLKVAKDNPARAFYDKLKFAVESEDDKYWLMSRTFES